MVITGIKVSDIDFDEKKMSFLESKKNRIWEVPLSEDMLVLIRKLLNSRGKNQSEYLISYRKLLRSDIIPHLLSTSDSTFAL